jgi:hypothetical protein
LGTALTTAVSPQANRSFIGVIPFQLLTAIGMFYLYWRFKEVVRNGKVKAVFNIVLSVLVVISLEQYVHRYFVEYPTYAANFWGWQYGAREAVSYMVEHHVEYDELYLEPAFNAPHIFLSFYDPENICKNCFIGNPQESYKSSVKQLFIITPEQINYLPFQAQILSVINYPNHTTAFLILKDSS